LATIAGVFAGDNNPYSVTTLGKISPFWLLFTGPISTQRSSFNTGFVFEGYKSCSIWMFWASKLSFDVEVWVFLAIFSKN
jgi:hypothetical protein